MATENRSFICRNLQCGSEDSLGGMLFQYEYKKGEVIQCPYCQSEYVEEGEGHLLKLADKETNEFSISSLDDYNEVNSKCDSVKIYFPKLIIKDIKAKDELERIISFGKCRIDELVIENIEIHSAFYPFSFAECSIGSLSIHNCVIKESKKKDYRSLWHFFGISFYRTDISKAFTIEGYKGSIVVSDCKIPGGIEIAGQSKMEIGLLNNNTDPKIKTGKNAEARLVFEVSGRDASSVEKKIETSGKAIKGLNVDELHVIKDTEGHSLVEDCKIKKLVFPDGGNIRSELIFKNCFIESIQNEPYSFDKNVIFFGCTFKNDLSFSGANFKQSLVLEACSFLKEAVFNDLNIEKDLHLSYSRFEDVLTISNNNCGGYIKSHTVFTKEGLKLEDNVVAREVNLRNMNSGKDFIFKNNEVNGYLFLRQVNIDGKLEINWLTTAQLDINDVRVDKSMDIQNSKIRNNLNINVLDLGGKADISFVKVEAEIMINSSIFKQETLMVACVSNMNIFINNDHKSHLSLHANTFKKTTSIQRNRIDGSLIWESMQSDETFFNNNFILGEVKVNKANANDLSFSDNMIHNGMSTSNSTTKDLSFFDNFIHEGFTITSCYSNNINLNDNEIEKAVLLKNLEANECKLFDNKFHESIEINNIESDDIYLINSEIKDQLSIYNLESNDLIFSGNKVPQTEIKNGNYGDISISECSELDNLVLFNVNARKDINIKECNFNDSLNVQYCKADSDIVFEENTMHKGFTLASTRADSMKFIRNRSLKCDFSMGSYRQISITACQELGEFSFNNVTAGKDVSISDCIFHQNFKMLYCQIENDLDLSNNTYKSEFSLFNNNVNGSINQSDVLVENSFRLNKNLIKGNLELKGVEFKSSFALFENIVEQQTNLSGLNFNTNLDIDLLKNRFNFVVLEALSIQSVLYFDNNVVVGDLRIGKREIVGISDEMIFPKAVSMIENKIRTALFSYIRFEAPVCFHKNNFEADLIFNDTSHSKALDFTGSYVGGSFMFNKTRVDSYDGPLILDNTFVDKRIGFNGAFPASFSFKNATFKGFEIPANWKMIRKKLRNSFITDRKEYLLKENNISNKKFDEVNLPYSLIKSHYESNQYFNELPEMWKHIQSAILLNEEKATILEKNIENGDDVIMARYYIDQCISKSFLPVYFDFFDKGLVDALSNLAEYFSKGEKKYEDESATEISETLQPFFQRFLYAMKFFQNHFVYWGSGDEKEDQKIYRNEITKSLEEQYKVLRQIYGDNGELTNEDWAYYQWMHYKNLSDMQGVPKKGRIMPAFSPRCRSASRRLPRRPPVRVPRCGPCRPPRRSPSD